MSSTTEVTPSRPVAPKPMRRDAARNREALLAAARVVFGQRGLDASLDDVARHAGVGVGTAYRHFSNKYELLSALMAQIVQQLITAAEATRDIADPRAAFVRLMECLIEAQVNDRGLREVMSGFHDTAAFEEAHVRIGAVLNETLERAKAAKVVRSDAGPSDAGVVINMLCAAADLTSEAGPDLWRRYLALILRGLEPAAEPLPERALSEDELIAAMRAYKFDKSPKQPC